MWTWRANHTSCGVGSYLFSSCESGHEKTFCLKQRVKTLKLSWIFCAHFNKAQIARDIRTYVGCTLQDMMYGTLDVRQEGFTRDSVKRPEWMDEVSADDTTEEQRKVRFIGCGYRV